jgi:outer membrane protein assembly factor BamB
VQAGAADWPRFRGDNGTGTSQDRDVPVEFSEGQNLVWKTPIPGLGNSSPIVWGDRIFLQSASADGKERLLVSLNLKDGKILWTKSLPGAKAKINVKNSLASSTPATDGERVYAVFWDGAGLTLHACDFQGNQLWQESLGGHKSQHGAAVSPIVHDGLVIVNNDQDGAAELVAHDARTGKRVWAVKRDPVRACYSTPFILKRAGRGEELIVASTTSIAGYEPRTGKENWHWTWKHSNMPLRTVASPVEAGGIVYACSGDGKGDRNTVAVKLGDKGDVTDSNLVWSSERANMPYVPCMLPHDGYLYYVNDKGLAACLNPKTGEEVWSQRLSGNVSSSPILVDGKIYTIAEDGEAHVFEAAPKFKLLSATSLGEPVFATPAVSQGKLLIRTQRYLSCFGKK